MKYLHTLYDHSLERNYKLYQMNAKELSERLKKHYNLPPMMLQLFNSESKLARNVKDIKELKAHGHILRKDDMRVQDVRKMVGKIKNNEHVQPMTKQGIHFGYEVMPVALSVKGDVENSETPIELMDGFKRLLVMDTSDIPDIDIMVKVYDSLDDREWINAMLLYNSWKYADSEGADKYMDRGFQLGLYYRYRLMFVNMILPHWDMFRAINIYTTGRDLESYWREGSSTAGVYKTFWNNIVFYDDIQAIYDILTSKPIFKVKKKGQIVEHDMKQYKYNNSGLNRILEVFVSLLGEVRRMEFNKGLTERKKFDRSILENYLNDESLQKQFVKVIEMSVDGFIMNHIRGHMREDMKKRMYEGMGHEYKAPEPIIKAPQKPFNLSDIKF
ncbi:hypothetical protein CVD28_03290 [Bacillus sp. M6-12]|uniref:hypothetical protein n=1 Tax=Bacillus sp. M6-12 TaxID=2054166 RepID=UPI000C7745B1|nr:hypothetical protein [Bacillus sp. M6-12]PLS19454.1 hypothetical protein CVD28_03290 [Bacillus sp. M6-12]